MIDRNTARVAFFQGWNARMMTSMQPAFGSLDTTDGDAFRAGWLTANNMARHESRELGWASLDGRCADAFDSYAETHDDPAPVRIEPDHSVSLVTEETPAPSIRPQHELVAAWLRGRANVIEREQGEHVAAPLRGAADAIDRGEHLLPPNSPGALPVAENRWRVGLYEASPGSGVADENTPGIPESER